MLKAKQEKYANEETFVTYYLILNGKHWGLVRWCVKIYVKLGMNYQAGTCMEFNEIYSSGVSWSFINYERKNMFACKVVDLVMFYHNVVWDERMCKRV